MRRGEGWGREKREERDGEEKWGEKEKGRDERQRREKRDRRDEAKETNRKRGLTVKKEKNEKNAGFFR